MQVLPLKPSWRARMLSRRSPSASSIPGHTPSNAAMRAAAAARIAAFDGVWPGIEDADGLRRDSIRARQLGFSGKTCIHPNQIDLVNEVFTPSAREVEAARGLVSAFEEAERGGTGAITYAGKMVDRPVVERARRVLRLSELSREVSR